MVKVDMGKEITYPIFLECAAYTEDHFWRSVFEEMAYEKTPYGCYITKGYLNCSFKGKEFSYRIPDAGDPAKVHADVMALVRDRLGVSSSSDKLRHIQDFARMEDEIKDLKNSKWTSIKKKTSKDFIIENFVIEMKAQWHLSESITRQLLGTIISGMIFKVYCPKDIHYELGKITAIDGLEFHEGGFSTRTLTESGVAGPVIVFNEKINLRELWYKHHGEDSPDDND